MTGVMTWVMTRVMAQVMTLASDAPTNRFGRTIGSVSDKLQLPSSYFTI